MRESRVIKKYPNRRLYDTEESRYITLAEIRQLVQENIPFQVIERKTQSDITTQVLLQVIGDLESRHGLLSPELLSEVIRSYQSGQAEDLNRRLLQALGPRSETRGSEMH
ncbi:MAG TPA: polyhydroxyalkanoate synthesis regulator DNA-binding domain-containing protein [Gammaproteobacteria bacterium]|nr:polyhydroxyalkanoate synthesis regulator DNA-binding domain-containing protein [Gammaproteobacteria bacterium]